MYKFQNMQIGSVNAIMNGLLRLTFIRWMKSSFTSYRLQYLNSPLCFLIFVAFRCKSTGEYVSGIELTNTNPQPAMMKTSQLHHRQPLYSVIKPPIMGPNTAPNQQLTLPRLMTYSPGPFSGPMLHMLKAKALYSSPMISPTVPGAFAIIALPTTALKNLTAMISAMLVARAHGMIEMKKRNVLIA